MEPLYARILNCIARLEAKLYFPNAAAEILAGSLHEKRRRYFWDFERDSRVFSGILIF